MKVLLVQDVVACLHCTCKQQQQVAEYQHVAGKLTGTSDDAASTVVPTAAEVTTTLHKPEAPGQPGIAGQEAAASVTAACQEWKPDPYV